MASQAEKLFSTGKPLRISKVLREALDLAVQAHLEAVEKLTEVLDRADGDADLEPSLGALQRWRGDAGDQRAWTAGDAQDREVDIQDEPHDPDADEPSLGWVGGANQVIAMRESTGAIYLPGTGKSAWAERAADLEMECEDEGAQCEDEGCREDMSLVNRG